MKIFFFFPKKTSKVCLFCTGKKILSKLGGGHTKLGLQLFFFFFGRKKLWVSKGQKAPTVPEKGQKIVKGMLWPKNCPVPKLM